MSIRLKITGGYGGPTTWQDLQLDENTMSAEELARTKSILNRHLSDQTKGLLENAPNIPDGLNYEFEFDEGADRKTLSLNQANLPAEVADVVQLMHNHSSKASHGEADDKEKEN